MELHRWYEGVESPDQSCDCLIQLTDDTLVVGKYTFSRVYSNNTHYIDPGFYFGTDWQHISRHIIKSWMAFKRPSEEVRGGKLNNETLPLVSRNGVARQRV